MKSKWIHQPQECEGTYMFSGQLLISAGIKCLLSDTEIQLIVSNVKSWDNELDGIDYLVVFKHQETDQKLFFIDQLNREMIASGQYKIEDNHATLILAEEY